MTAVGIWPDFLASASIKKRIPSTLIESRSCILDLLLFFAALIISQVLEAIVLLLNNLNAANIAYLLQIEYI
ncbi:MAG: hypothetical protein F6J93_38940 [Oscillatoria sp. SIO1A7]|nr:hypothetical protein [Oscillatoria sp. SIO1A7]